MCSSAEMCDGKSAVCSIFKPGKGPEWFGEIGKILGNPDDVKKWTDTHLENGYFNHTFIPTGMDSPVWWCTPYVDSDTTR